MTDFRFIPIAPHPLLRPYIAKINVFESGGRLPATERKLIVPNANFKLTLTYRNGIVACIGGKTYIQAENKLSLTGLIDLPVILDPHEDAQTGTIIIEFNPLGAYRFFYLSYAEVKNQIIELADLVGHSAVELRSQLAEASALSSKLELLQNFLIKQLEKIAPDPIYDYCINRISDSRGLVSVAQLEKETGYSSRWLHAKFSEHLGTGPKNLSEIVRFKQFYQAFSAGANYQTLKEQIYHHYHDQSHFIRAFKRFTGSTLTDLQNSMNELSTKNFTT
ncbi:AraC family transcriptional regulator [Mucilaginibacter sp. UR6-11]|uniref:helix-turn-helix domain-containing protein n=1 Tax=Mucilaginibacter sp. UR6-11 TaxID=1435644 RepID=UPI001E541B2A|nr:AraC family transcriptional regulator [Mucilaginibacter sp. UR6-11]MCC8424574.1 AraC family transcriptional regulator [Mucilaginibacter sp. UR6-11]